MLSVRRNLLVFDLDDAKVEVSYHPSGSRLSLTFLPKRPVSPQVNARYTRSFRIEPDGIAFQGITVIGWKFSAPMSDQMTLHRKITPLLSNQESKEFIKDWAPGKGVEEYVISANIEAIKPVTKKSCC